MQFTKGSQVGCALALATTLSLLSNANADHHESTTEPGFHSLFNGKDLEGWYADVPAADKNPEIKPSFIVREGKLVSMGKPLGHLISKKSYKDYRFYGVDSEAHIGVRGHRLDEPADLVEPEPERDRRDDRVVLVADGTLYTEKFDHAPDDPVAAGHREITERLRRVHPTSGVRDLYHWEPGTRNLRGSCTERARPPG